MLLRVFTKGRERMIQYLLTGSQNQNYQGKLMDGKGSICGAPAGFAT